MSLNKLCINCGHTPCLCRPWCPGKRQCIQPQHIHHHCAGPLIYTNEDNIGDRPCCGGLQKCQDKSGLRQWCSHTGKCPSSFSSIDYPPAPGQFKNYYDFLVKKEKYQSPRSVMGYGVI